MKPIAEKPPSAATGWIPPPKNPRCCGAAGLLGGGGAGRRAGAPRAPTSATFAGCCCPPPPPPAAAAAANASLASCPAAALPPPAASAPSSPSNLSRSAGRTFAPSAAAASVLSAPPCSLRSSSLQIIPIASSLIITSQINLTKPVWTNRANTVAERRMVRRWASHRPDRLGIPSTPVDTLPPLLLLPLPVRPARMALTKMNLKSKLRSNRRSTPLRSASLYT
mmetsp:Transcript_39003/g.79829  ORF Transcript_39003/g.79829 Transcript_39003/m.79829 type:complete len:223 (+) Transcript_39003:586-1254(+)